MDIVETIFLALVLVIILPMVFSILWFCKTRAEKKLSINGAIKTRPPKILSGFFLGFGLLVLLGGIAGIIYCCITDSENTTVTAIIVISLCIAAFSALGFFGYGYVRFNYVVADDEGVMVFRLFKKKKYYRYEEIGSFHDTINMGMIGGLIGYDKNNKKIFAIEALHIGAAAVAQKLREHHVNEKIQNQLLR